MSECTCPGDTLTYECTAMGGGSTVWTGTFFFDCLATTKDTVLLHRRFLSTTGTSATCNNGAIVARSLSVEGNNYTSQLNVTVTPDIGAKLMKCYDNRTAEATLSSWVIPTIGLSPCKAKLRSM